MALHRSLRLLLYVPTALAPAALLGLMLASPSPVAAASHAVTIFDDGFAPAALTVNVGDTVTWTNTGEDPHTVTADNGAFNSGRLDPGASFTFTFTTAGSFGYRCDFHSDMTAQVTVQAAAAPPADAGGAPAPVAPPADAGDAAAPAPAGEAAGPAPASAGGNASGTVPTTAIIPEPLSPSVLLVLLGVGVFYTTLVVAMDSASKRV